MRRSIDDLGPGVDVVPLENWMVTVLDRSERFNRRYQGIPEIGNRWGENVAIDPPVPAIERDLTRLEPSSFTPRQSKVPVK